MFLIQWLVPRLTLFRYIAGPEIMNCKVFGYALFLVMSLMNPSFGGEHAMEKQKTEEIEKVPGLQKFVKSIDSCLSSSKLKTCLPPFIDQAVFSPKSVETLYISRGRGANLGQDGEVTRDQLIEVLMSSDEMLKDMRSCFSKTSKTVKRMSDGKIRFEPKTWSVCDVAENDGKWRVVVFHNID